MSGWGVLVLAGAVEIAWSQTIRPTEGFTRLGPTVLCLVLGGTAVYLLSQAMQTVPVGTAYVVFTGIGAVGAVTLGVALYDDPLSLGRLAALALIVGGIALARATAGP